MAQDDRGYLVRHLVLRGEEEATEMRGRTEQVEELGRGPSDADQLRRAVVRGEERLDRLDQPHPIVRIGALLEVADVRQ